MEKFYIVKRELSCNGCIFNQEHRNFKDPEKVLQFFEESVKIFTENNKDMVDDKYNYRVEKGGRKYSKYCYCYYKFNPKISYFSIEMSQENLE